MKDDEYFMQEALAQAQLAFDCDEVPVGAVLVKDNQIIARAHNQSITNNDPTAHAEILALREAASVLKNYRLIDTTLYVTLEPCAMCAMALVHARVKYLVFAASDPRTGACGSVFQIASDSNLNHQLNVSQGVLKLPGSDLLKTFFKNRR